MAIGDTTYVNSVRDQLLAGRTRLSEVLGAQRERPGGPPAGRSRQRACSASITAPSAYVRSATTPWKTIACATIHWRVSASAA